MSFDWISFLDHYNIPYSLGGKNVSHGNIGLPCPMCGDDPSQHLGINPQTGYWNCWRNSQHKGRKPHKLIMRLLKCSYAEAASIAGDSKPLIGDFLSQVQTKLMKPDLKQLKTTSRNKTPKLNLLPEFRPILNKGVSSRFYQYLMQRGFSPEEVRDLCDYYGLLCSLTGNYENRIIIPVYYKSKLVSWTSRSILPSEQVRYKSLSHKKESSYTRQDPPALMSIKSLVYNYDQALYGGKILFVVEGPFDAIKLDYYVKEHNCHAICVFGVNIAEEQLSLINELSRKYSKIIIVPDKGATHNAMSLLHMLSNIKVKIQTLPDKFKDAGDLSKTDVMNLLDEITRDIRT